MTSRRWCWTLNNYNEADLDHIKESAKTCKYLIYGKETASTGTPHLQGFLICKQPSRLAGIKKLISVRVHAEKARGTSAQASTYCKKENNFIEYGTITEESGSLEDATELCMDNADGYKLTAKTHPTHFVKYWRGFKELHHLASPVQQRNHKTNVEVIISTTGTNKSRCSQQAAQELGSEYYKKRGQ